MAEQLLSQMGSMTDHAGLIHQPERRLATRYACILDAAIEGRIIHVGKGWLARVKDLSLDGIGLHIGESIPSGAELSLGVYGSGYALPKVKVRVIRCQEQPGGTWFLGLSFDTPLDDLQLKQLLS